MDSWHIVFYDDVSLINKLHFFNIDVYGFKKIDDSSILTINELID